MERHRESSRNQGVCIEISYRLGSLSKYEESPYYFTFKGRYVNKYQFTFTVFHVKCYVEIALFTCVSVFLLRTRAGWRLAEAIALTGKPRVLMTQRKKCPSGTGRRVEAENFATQEFFNRLARSPSDPLSQGYFLQQAMAGDQGRCPYNPTSGHPEAEGAKTAFSVYGALPQTPFLFGIAQKETKRLVFFISITAYRETLSL